MVDPDSQNNGAEQADSDELKALERRVRDLRDERDKFQSLYEWAPDMCASIDVGDATVVRCNNRLLEDLGWERTDVVGSSILRIVHPDDRPQLAAAVEQLAEGGEMRDMEVRFRRRDGESLPATLNITLRRDSRGRILYGRAVGRDITKQKEVANELALGEARLRNLAEALNVVPWQVTALPSGGVEEAAEQDRPMEYCLDYIGPQFEKVFGYRRGRWYEPGFWAEVVHRDDAERVVDSFVRWMSAPGSYHEEYRVLAADHREMWVLHLVNVVVETDGRRVLTGVLVDITETRKAEATQTALMDELDHRVRNTLATVVSMMDQTLLLSEDVEPFLAAFRGRVESLGAIHNAMAGSEWSGVDLDELVAVSLAPFGVPPRVESSGQPVWIAQEVGPSLGMVLHELATNATKHGALSVLSGAVSVSWRVEERRGTRRLILEWREAGGPPVREADHQGYGMRLIEYLVPHKLGGKAAVDRDPAGLRCRISVPLGRAGDDSVLRSGASV